MSENVTRNEQVIRDLQQKLQKAESRRDKISAERSSLGLAVHVEGKPQSRKALDALNDEASSIAGEIESLNGALAVAGENLSAAKAGVARAVDEAKAQELLELADE